MSFCAPLDLALIQLSYKGNNFTNLETKLQASMEWINCPQAVIKGGSRKYSSVSINSLLIMLTSNCRHINHCSIFPESNSQSKPNARNKWHVLYAVFN